MARYDVYPNPGGGYVLDVQADLLDELKTRIVIPLIGKTSAPLPAKRLNPSFEIEGEDYILVTQFMAAIPISALKEPVTNLKAAHDEIVAALDMAFHGF
ncbi:CcdB family protein [Brucella haematophila]|uniref:Toxin CcdB n=1 Tax=Brucella haematophila TaxID=419474 RepID=A0ABX1DQG8_9HYPH|nr:CcdB family protein [Brucella haematophila]NKC05188.1 plasmid maintenance protein CcdB [Brucella haematophila]TMU95399.1 plasmid maintenance protein CcdB [Brucella haematophila]